MKLFSVLLISCAALTFAADPQSQAAKNATLPDGGNARVYKKLGAVTWDPDAHKLAWTVETGNMVNGQFVPASKETYEIAPDDATMNAAGEKRGFDDEEAADLHRLLDVLSLYCAQSVAWWEAGAGTPVESKPTGSDSPGSGKPVKINGPSAPAAPPVKIAPGMAVAKVQGVH